SVTTRHSRNHTTKASTGSRRWRSLGDRSVCAATEHVLAGRGAGASFRTTEVTVHGAKSDSSAATVTLSSSANCVYMATVMGISIGSQELGVFAFAVPATAERLRASCLPQRSGYRDIHDMGHVGRKQVALYEFISSGTTPPAAGCTGQLRMCRLDPILVQIRDFDNSHQTDSPAELTPQLKHPAAVA
ncbi:hypothetical protein BaRGS_00000252, partial [Batillaria attramentaria]